jgi:hypothetical protein
MCSIGDINCWLGINIGFKFLDIAINIKSDDITVFVDNWLDGCNNILFGSCLLEFFIIYFNVNRFSRVQNFNDRLF